jgi:hypothetical protein
MIIVLSEMIVNQDNRVDIEKQPQEVDLLKAVFL